MERPWSMHRRDGQESVGPQEGCQVRERVRGPRALTHLEPTGSSCCIASEGVGEAGKALGGHAW